MGTEPSDHHIDFENEIEKRRKKAKSNAQINLEVTPLRPGEISRNTDISTAHASPKVEYNRESVYRSLNTYTNTREKLDNISSYSPYNPMAST